MSYLYAKLHDQDGEVELTDLTNDGLQEGRFQARRLIEEIDDEVERRKERGDYD